MMSASTTAVNPNANATGVPIAMSRNMLNRKTQIMSVRVIV